MAGVGLVCSPILPPRFTAMFFLRRPTAKTLDAIAREQSDLPFTQPAVGATRSQPLAAPTGFDVDSYGVVLGRGRETFERACAAIRRFDMYPSGWTEVHHLAGDPELRPDKVFVAVIRHFGFYSALPCRIVYTVDDGATDATTDTTNDAASNSARRFGFALGTLPGHAECGEERFEVSWNAGDDTVRYDVLAYSRPRALLARLGYPIVRALQKRFARDSQANMLRVVPTTKSI